MRAAADGKTVGIIESTTWEEACSEWKAWVRQRTRWIKGYMVTALVHMRRPRQLYRETGARGVFGVLGLIAGTPAMFLACPLVWGFWLFTFLGGNVPGFHLPSWVATATLVNLLVGNGAMILLTALAARRRQAYDLIPFALLNPGVLGAALHRRVPRALATRGEPVALGEDPARDRARAAPPDDRRGDG